ncbi:unnamed protein product [Orchesella dallaii]|uniref:Uncharacterized protein n=1 Tax=Orchesella dallaii TaxID=48710 RepID=A0ABP1QE79_9HEXA
MECSRYTRLRPTHCQCSTLSYEDVLRVLKLGTSFPTCYSCFLFFVKSLCHISRHECVLQNSTLTELNHLYNRVKDDYDNRLRPIVMDLHVKIIVNCFRNILRKKFKSVGISASGKHYRQHRHLIFSQITTWENCKLESIDWREKQKIKKKEQKKRLALEIKTTILEFEELFSKK